MEEELEADWHDLATFVDAHVHAVPVARPNVCSMAQLVVCQGVLIWVGVAEGSHLPRGGIAAEIGFRMFSV